MPGLKTRPLSTADLIRIAREVAASPDRWLNSVRFDPSRRCWSRLPADPGVDLWLLTWLPTQSTDLHDHGGSLAAVVVVHGDLSEVRADRDGRLDRIHRPQGSAFGVEREVVHDVHAGTAPAVSIHAYSPRLTRMSYYEARPTGLQVARTLLVDAPEPEPVDLP